MTAIELERKQAELHEKIKEHAKNLGVFKEGEFEPIYDGVVDCEGYLNSSPKIMWVLKEPYDELGEDGLPFGGGWKLHHDIKDVCQITSASTKVVLQTSYAIRHNLEWKNIPYIQNEPQGMLEVLQQIAFLNVSKMPALTKTDMNKLWKKNEIWNDILAEQISVYQPDVIICGKTIDFLEFLDIGEAKHAEKSGRWSATGFMKNNCIIIDAYHPGRKGGEDHSRDFVNSILNTYNKLKLT